VRREGNSEDLKSDLGNQETRSSEKGFRIEGNTNDVVRALHTQRQRCRSWWRGNSIPIRP
jgi:hypothetical protein